MSYDGNGTFIRIMNWVADAAASIDIKADRHDQQDDDYAAGLSNVICKDGQTQPTANIPMNGKRLVNLGDPVNPQDAATRAFALAVKTFSTGMEISGADANGQIRFSSPTGANGLSFTGADLSWIARLATAAGPGTPPVPPATLNRLVLNDKPDGSGADVVVINDNGTIVSAGQSIVGASAQLTLKPTSGNGAVQWYATDGTTVRMALYTDSAAAWHGYLAVQAQVFIFGNNGVFVAPAAVVAGSASMGTDGNINGSVWNTWGHPDAYSAIANQIEARGAAFANDRVATMQFRKTSPATFGRGAFQCPAGAVITGMGTGLGAGEFFNGTYHYLQSYDVVRGWVTFQG